jgi:lipopolysaccharide/colanic/teichoic acid biosynthesis glycosyltransferase
LKRLFDIVLALTGLLLSAPIWIVVAVLVKLQDGGPIFFVQERWGRNGARIQVRKFRTMRVQTGVDADRPAERNDIRVTGVGKVLRAAGLDELPQLWSILTGDMSFVGPRALSIGERVRDGDGELKKYESIPGFTERLRVRPGLTGWTTVYFPKDLPVREKFAQDMRYIEMRDFGLDLRLFALSLWISLRGKWESRTPKL